MKKLLHIIATPRGEESRTLQVSRAFLASFKRSNPDCEIDELNVFDNKLPELTIKAIDGKYVLLSGKEIPDDLKEAWQEIEDEIKRFLSADRYLVSSPMWNFSIPYPLKHYIDIIMQPQYLFRYTPEGPEGLLKDKKMVVITSRGGNYSPDSPSYPYDRQEPYIRTVFGFAGIMDLDFINAQPMDAGGPEMREEKLEQARKEAIEIAKTF
jgi:FMN-dependent NADH-azoreductase